MIEKFFYATIITVLLPILLGISPFEKSKNLNIHEVTQKDHQVQSYIYQVYFSSQG
ncbi:MAG: hypothetical protein AB4080_01800 [Trichodesmium sp.]